MNKLQSVLTSRKFWASVVGAVVVVANKLRPEGPLLSEPEVMAFVGMLVSYVLGTALEDGLASKANSKA